MTEGWELQNQLFAVFDPRLQNIVLHRTRYLRHIQLRHPFITVDAIRETVEDPDFITDDVNSEFIENYYAQGVIDDNPDAFLKVCVLFKGGEGRVVTAFGVDRPKDMEGLLWQK